MQKLFVIGNLTHDPELSETASGVAKCTFSVAVNRTYTRGDGERGTDYFSCIAWRGIGETIARYCKKGSKIYLEGKLEQRSYEDNQGIKRTVYDYIIDNMELLPNGKREVEEADEPTGEWTKPRRKKPTMQPMDDSDGEIPF